MNPAPAYYKVTSDDTSKVNQTEMINTLSINESNDTIAGDVETDKGSLKFTTLNDTLNTPKCNEIEIDQPPAVSTLDVCNKCTHSHLLVSTERALCATIVCYTCCISAILAVVAAAIICIIAMFKDGSSGHNHSNFGGGYNGNCHWYPMLLYYNIDPIIVNSKPKVSFEGDNNVPVCCCNLEIPHKYKITCKNCGEILKSGFKRGSLLLTIFLGVSFVSLFVYFLYLAFWKH